MKASSGLLVEFLHSRSKAVFFGLKSSFELKLSTSRFVVKSYKTRLQLGEPWAFHIAKGAWLLNHSQGPRRETLALISTMITTHLRYCAIRRQQEVRAIGLQCSAWGALLTRLLLLGVFIKKSVINNVMLPSYDTKARIQDRE